MPTDAREFYLTGLRNQHAVEKQAIETIEKQLDRMSAYPDLHARMKLEHSRSEAQRARLEELLTKHGSSPSGVKETVTSVVGTVAGLVHVTADDEVIKNVLAAVGYKAYEIASYKTLLAAADRAGASADKPVLEGNMKEDMEMGDWLGEHLPGFVDQYLTKG
jgi:ferritin-like metal-binding protein YciE